MKRRHFIRLAGSASMLCASGLLSHKLTGAEPRPNRLPRWRGFNLLEKFTARRNAPFRESDFEWMAEWGFDFVRLPLSYHCWADPEDWLNLKEQPLKEIDQAVEFGRQYGVHVNINFHRAPGYCVNPPEEKLSLWESEKAVAAACFHWAHFAERYQGIPSERVSFDLLNEPAQVSEATYARVMKRMIEAIRDKDPKRLIIADGLQYGREPVPALADSGIAQSTRGYDPMRISHYRANWINGSDQWPKPEWPLQVGDRVWDKARLYNERIKPWLELEKQGVGIHVGEWGAFNKTPHAVALAWMRDCLDLWKAAGWGWALWNFRGSFGILDSGRADVQYESFKGHSLDRRMLELLRTG